MQKTLYLHEITELYTALVLAKGVAFPEKIRYAAGKNQRLLRSLVDASEEVRTSIADRFTPDEEYVADEKTGKTATRKKMKDNGANYDMFDFNGYQKAWAKHLNSTDTVDLHCIPLADLDAVKDLGQGIYTAMLTMTNEEPGLPADAAVPVPTKPAMKAKSA